MAEAFELSAIMRLRDEASGALANVNRALEANRQRWQAHSQALRTVGLQLAAAGAAFSALGGLAVKSAQEESVGIARLDAALRTVGQSYQALEEPIERVLIAQQRMTNFSDGQQRDALQRLITISQDYKASMEALPVVLDVAAGGAMDLQAAALLVGKALAGETSSLTRYGILLEEGASKTEIMAALTKQFGGAAQAAANPFTQLKNAVGDLQESLGAILLPIVQSVVVHLADFANLIQAVAREHPVLTRVIVLNAAAFGALALTAGAFLLVLPQLTAGLAVLGIGFQAALGPIGLVTLAISGAITAFALLTGRSRDAADAVSGNSARMSAETRAANEQMRRDAAETEERVKVDLERLGNATQKALEARYARERELRDVSLQDQRESWQRAADVQRASIEAAQRVTNEDALRNRNLAERTAQAQIDAFNDVLRARLTSLAAESRAVQRSTAEQLDSLRRAHSDKLQLISDELQAQVAAFNEAATARLGQANAELRALDSEAAALEKAAQGQADAESRSRLETAITEAQAREQAKDRERLHFLDIMNSVEDMRQRQAAADSALRAQNEMKQATQNRVEAEAALARWLMGIDQRAQQEQIDAKRQAVRDRMAGIQEEQKTAVDALRTEAEARRRHENELYEVTQDNLRKTTQARLDALNAQVAQEQTAFAGRENAERQALAVTLASIETARGARVRELEIEGRLFTQRADLEIGELDRALTASQSKYDAEMAGAHTAALALLDQARTDNNALIALLKTYDGQWQGAGQTWGQQLLDGLRSQKVTIEAEVAAILADLQTVTDLRNAPPVMPGPGGGTTFWPPQPVPAPTPLPGFAGGGIVTRPTMAIIGEHGPEAVVPLVTAGGARMAGNTIIVHYHQEAPVYGFEDFERQVAKAVRDTKLAGGFHGVL